MHGDATTASKVIKFQMPKHTSA